MSSYTPEIDDDICEMTDVTVENEICDKAIELEDAVNRYGKLTIIKEVEPHVQPSGVKRRKVLCKCGCGNYKEVQLSEIIRGKTNSCGCLQKERTAESNTTHKLTNHRLYGTWKQMLSRCNNVNHKHFKNYGGRGIKVCDEWMDIKIFINDMYPSFKEGLTLDRIDNDKGYFKDNCRWATSSEQSLNQRIYGEISYRGVSFHKSIGKYRAQIQFNGKRKHLGYYLTPKDAGKAYNDFVIANKLNNKLN